MSERKLSERIKEILRHEYAAEKLVAEVRALEADRDAWRDAFLAAAPRCEWPCHALAVRCGKAPRGTGLYCAEHGGDTVLHEMRWADAARRANKEKEAKRG